MRGNFREIFSMVSHLGSDVGRDQPSKLTRQFLGRKLYSIAIICVRQPKALLILLMFFPLASGIHYRQLRAKQSVQTDQTVDAPDRAKTP